ncbi:MAG: ATP-binding protein [Candidatus Methylacidiphilales bacterium]|nr:ATP-binding protein [Candidatus Methylacidiphilales bacterium]
MKPDAASQSPLERDFLDYNRDFRISTSKVGCLLAFVLMPAGTLLDHFVYPEMAGSFLFLRLICAALAGVLFLLLSWPAFARRWFRELGLSWFILPSAFICLMIYQSEGVRSPYYAGLTLVLIAVSWVAQVTVLESATAFILTLAMYVAACSLQGDSDTRLLFNNLYFIILTGVVMITGNYFLNRLRFREFANRQQLDASRREIESSHRKLMELDQMKGRFFANISHELRTPLTLLVAPLERLRTSAARTAEESGLLDLMHNNALRLLKLINDLLELVRLQEGKTTLDLVRVAPSDFLHGLARLAQPLAERNKVTLSLSIADGLGELQADPDKMEKAVLNLLFNALKFTPAGGTVTLGARDTAENLEITVADTGPGIPPEDQQRIFDPFWQADQASTRKHQGAGLGLALVKDLTEAHGGSVRLDSTPGHGATFTLLFPRVPAAMAPTAASNTPVPPAPAEKAVPAAPTEETTDPWLANLYRKAEYFPTLAPPSENGTQTSIPDGDPDLPVILIADDEPQMLRFLSSQLSREFHVLAARDGREALDLIHRHQPQLAVLDYMMPALDGLATCKALRQQEATRHLPVILLTARADEESRLQTLEAGATDFLTKPFSGIELLVRCRNLVRLRAAQTELSRTLETLRETEDQLVHSAKMASLGQLSAGILHEVNNPLNFSSGALRAIERRLDSLASNEGRATLEEMLRDLRTGLERAQKITSDLRSFTHPDATDVRPVQMEEVFRIARALVSHQLQGVSLTQECDPRLGIEGNANQLVHLVTNLLQNALDSLAEQPAQGTIHLSWKGRNNHAELAVRDNGAGIPPDIQKRVFDPFFTTKEVGKGVGLGLSTCYRIACQHGATIHVRSEPGRFCEFTVQFPLPDSVPNLSSHPTENLRHAGNL